MTNSMKEAFEKASKEFLEKELKRATFKLMSGKEPTEKELKKVISLKITSKDIKEASRNEK
jgi:hypothetical protein